MNGCDDMWDTILYFRELRRLGRRGLNKAYLAQLAARGPASLPPVKGQR